MTQITCALGGVGRGHLFGNIRVSLPTLSVWHGACMGACPCGDPHLDSPSRECAVRP